MNRFMGTLFRETPDPAGGAAPPAPDAAAIAAAAAAAAPPDPPAAPEPVVPPAPPAKPWYLTRLSEESGKRQSAEEREAAALRRAEAAEAVAARLAAGEKPPNGERLAAPAERTIPPDAVRAEAERLRFLDDSVEVLNRGLAEYGSAFNETTAVLRAVNAATDEFVADVMAVSKADAHKLFKQIADDPEKAVRLAGMNSRQRIAELTRMTLAAPKPAETPAPVVPAAPAATVPAARVSKAPEPAPRIDPGATKVVDGYSDEATDAQFTAKFEEGMKARSGRR